MRVVLKAIFHFLVIIVYRPKVTGRENIPKEGGALICPNHVHALDSAVILTTQKRQVYFMAKEVLFKNAFIKWLAKIFGIFPVRREGKDIEAIKTSLRILKGGNLLTIFPEGTRNGLAKGVKPKSGSILIAAKAGVPIIPCGVNGTCKPFTKVTLNYGKPIFIDKDANLSDKDVLEKYTIDLMDEIVRLSKIK